MIPLSEVPFDPSTIDTPNNVLGAVILALLLIGGASFYTIRLLYGRTTEKQHEVDQRGSENLAISRETRDVATDTHGIVQRIENGQADMRAEAASGRDEILRQIAADQAAILGELRKRNSGGGRRGW